MLRLPPTGQSIEMRRLTQDGGADAEAEGDAQECGESLKELEWGEIMRNSKLVKQNYDDKIYKT